MMLVQEFIASLEVDGEQRHENLTIFPLRSGLARELDILTCEEALDAGVLTVEEVGTGRVPVLRATNTGRSPVLLVSGEIIRGNRQDRVVVGTCTVNTNSEAQIPVRCVESSRWSRPQGAGRKSPYALFTSLRRDIQEGESQGRIWSQIAQTSHRLAAKSPTNNVLQMYEDRARQIEEYQEKLKVGPEHVGVLVGNGEGKVTAGELFGVKEFFHRQFGTLISGYVLDSLDSNRNHGERLSPREFLNNLRNAEFIMEEDHDGASSVKITSPTISGRVYGQEEEILHVVAYA